MEHKDTQGNTVLINHALSAVCPDGFHVLDREEMKEIYLNDNPDRWSIRDRERKMTLSVFWHRTFSLLVAFADPKSAVRKIDRQLKKALAGRDYRSRDLAARNLCGQKAWGFEYEYLLNDVPQSCEVILLRHRDCTYTVYYYSDKDREEENRPVFEAFLDSLRFEA